MFPFCHRPEPTNFLIKNNASVSAVDKVNRNTPLHCAVLAGNVDAAHILLEAGASVEAENINVSFNKFKHFFFSFFFTLLWVHNVGIHKQNIILINL